MLSRAAFRDLADVALVVGLSQLSRSKLNQFRTASTVYIHSDHLAEVLADPPSGWSPRIVIAAGSDLEFHEIPSGIPKSARALFLQNCFISDNDRIFTLPIGLEDASLGINGVPSLFKPPKAQTLRRRVLIGPYSDTHPVRAETLSTFLNLPGPWDVQVTPLRTRELDQAMRRYTHVLALRGNGVDTHRAWEAVYRGSRPIVANNAWSSSLSSMGAPLEVVDDLRPETLTAVVHGEMAAPLRPEDIPFMWMPYWEQLLTAASRHA